LVAKAGSGREYNPSAAGSTPCWKGAGSKGCSAKKNESVDADAGVAAADCVALPVAMDAAKTNPDVAEGVLAYLEK
jgi:hypothetical protein